MMNLGDMEDAILDAKAAIEAQTAGLMQLSGGLAVQTEMLKQSLKLMTEIRDLLTTEPDAGDSPLVSVMRQLVTAIEGQGLALARIEAAGKR